MVKQAQTGMDASSVGSEPPLHVNGHCSAELASLSARAGGRRIGVVANRGSGSGLSVQLVGRLERELKRFGLETEVAWTQEERQELAAEAGNNKEYRCLVAVGGDGTVSALVNEKPRVPITVLPAGTENLAAQHFGLKRDPAWLARTIATGHVIRTDLGNAGVTPLSGSGRRFILMTGFGFDGDIVSRHHRSRTSHSGRVKPTHRAAYVEPILRSSFTYRFPPINVQILDPDAAETLEGTTVFIFNLPRYALGLPFAPHASQDDGLLDLVVFRKPGAFQALYYLWQVLLGTHLNHPEVFHRRVRRICLTSQASVPSQLDGDPAGHLTPSPHTLLADQQGEPIPGHGLTIEVVPGAVDLIVAASQLGAESSSSLVRRRVAR
jgi:diacylglycerol kinase (ATP)